MRLLLLLALASSLAFAVGSGYGTSLVFALEQNFSCPGNVLTVTAVDPSGPLPGVLIEVSRYGDYGVLSSEETGPDGKASFDLGQDGAYNVKGTKSGYDAAYLLASIKACEAETAGTFYCADKATLRERVRCVMGLPDDDVLNVRFVPEECRALGGAERMRCLATYRLLQTCRIGLDGNDSVRDSCIRPKLGIGQDISALARSCAGNQTCMGGLREKVYLLAKFRMYNLEYKVQEMVRAGLDEDDAVEFIAYLEDAKARFNEASTIDGKKAIIMEVRDAWRGFVAEAKAKLGVEG